jgi:hypothetical protein
MTETTSYARADAIRSKIKIWVDYSLTELKKVITALYRFCDKRKFQNMINSF